LLVASCPFLLGAAQHCIKPTAPLARADGGETRFGACLLAEGFSPQSARRLMLADMLQAHGQDAVDRLLESSGQKEREQ